MSEILNIIKEHYDNEKLIGAVYAADVQLHNMGNLLDLSNELKKDYPEIPSDSCIEAFKSKPFKDNGPLIVRYIRFKNRKTYEYTPIDYTEDIYKLYGIEDDYVWFEYFTTIGDNDIEHLNALANEIYKDFPNVNATDIQIKNDMIKYIPRKFYLRFSVLKKDVNFEKLGDRVVNSDDVSYGDNSCL